MDSWSWLARKRLISLLALVYFTSLCTVLLYPFEFATPPSTTTNTASIQSDGIHFGTSGQLRTVSPPVSLYDRLIAGEGLTLELWVRTASAEQGGPARILSYSLDPWHRNFTLGQEGSALVTRLRTSQTGGASFCTVRTCRPTSPRRTGNMCARPLTCCLPSHGTGTPGRHGPTR